MLAFPRIKLNLGLYITRKRQDGYHDLLTCFYPVHWTDILEIVPASEFVFVQTGTLIPGEVSQNLCIKAYELLKEQFHLPPVQLHLHKLLPMGAGLGGGSADAAFVLKTLNALFTLKLPVSKLEEFAARLGSDCAYFLHDVPMIGSGRGEVLEPVEVDIKDQFLVVIYPSVHISTADAFGGVQPAPYKENLKEVLQNKSSWKEFLHNQFEDTVFLKYPVLAEIKHTLYNMGAWYASMSGSGSAVFGLFNTKTELPASLQQYPHFVTIL